MHALIRSIGPFSAGTRVKILSDNRDGTVNIEVMVPEPKRQKDDAYDFEDMVFDIEKTELVELRNHSDEVPQLNRHERRLDKRKIYELLHRRDQV